MKQVNEKDAVGKMKKFLVIMDSMTNDELDCKVPLCDSRITRVARGSGAHILEIKFLLEEFKRLKKMLNGFSKSKLGKGNQLENIARNPNQIMKKMQNFMDPRMLQQLGGMGNVMNMVKQM